MKENEHCKIYNDNLVGSQNMIELLKENMLENGYAIQVLPVERLNDLKRDVEELKSSDLFSDVINTIVSDFYNFVLPESPFEINSIIVAASAKPLVEVNFHMNNKVISLLHHNYVDIYSTVSAQKCLSDFLDPKGYHVMETVSLPQKLLAVRSGLAEYGRNNITYVDGMGSLHDITTFYSDLPCMDNGWHEIRQMDTCKMCMACLDCCPTGAITKERHLIKAERCLTYLNEFIWPGVREFPGWLDTSAHNCIHGCIKCQINCPENMGFMNNIVGPVEFNDEEVILLLEGKSIDEIPEDTVIKLNRLNLADDYFDLLPRNLKVLLNK